MSSRKSCRLLSLGRTSLLALITGSIVATASASTGDDEYVIERKGTQGAGVGKRIVLVAGDHEYRSEEAMPQLAKILADRHGFDTATLFPIDRKTGEINPDKEDDIPGLDRLAGADAAIFFLRMRDLPDEQMKHILDFLNAGKPFVAIRTTTHAFAPSEKRNYRSLHWTDKETDGGFGRIVLGESWLSHHGKHAVESCRGELTEAGKTHPILRGIDDRSIWVPTDVYGVRLPLPGDSLPLVNGRILDGMNETARPVDDKRNDPMMPVAWTKTYQLGDGKKGKVFCTTMGSSVDMNNEGFRRLLVNATYWAAGLEENIPASSAVDIVGKYEPSMFKFKGFKVGLKPADYAKD